MTVSDPIPKSGAWIYTVTPHHEGKCTVDFYAGNPKQYTAVLVIVHY
jgi:hypothetical protein